MGMLWNRDYVDDLTRFFDYMGSAQLTLGRFSRAVAAFCVCFPHSKYKVLVQDWTSLVFRLILGRVKLTGVGCFTYLESCSSNDGGTVVEMSAHISGAGSAYAGLKRCWCWPDISLKSKTHVSALPQYVHFCCIVARHGAYVLRMFATSRFPITVVCVGSLGLGSLTARVLCRLRI